MELVVTIWPIVTYVYNKARLEEIMHDESRSHEQPMNVHCLLYATYLFLNIFRGGMMRAFAFTNDG
jgi:hypothetical protein